MSVEIKYNGNTIASVEGGKIATIPCKGKKMAGDIVVKGDSDIKYKGETLATLSNGQTATIPCNGKIMQDNITVIALETITEYKLSGVWKFNESVNTGTFKDRNPPYTETIFFKVPWEEETFGYKFGSEITISNYISNHFEYEVDNYVQFKTGGGTRTKVVTAEDSSEYISNWVDERYKTIIIETEQTVSKEFYEWFTANATFKKQLITFAIEDTTYIAEQGMTWSEWIESDYNTGGFYNNGAGKLINNNAQYITAIGGVFVIESDIIESGYSYFLYQGTVD